MTRIRIATRREFLHYGLGIVGVGSTLPNYLIQTALGAPTNAEPGQKVLVVVQLNGGHDGMSALVPFGHEEYGKLRNKTRIQDNEVLKINNELGLHPELKGFKELLDQGQFAALPGVGYPNPNLSHFHSQDIWHTANMAGRRTPGPYGWIGRAADVGFAGNPDPKLTVAVGTGFTPISIQGAEHPGLCFQVPDSFKYVGDRGDQKRAEVYRKLNELAKNEPQPLQALHFVTQTALVANASSEQIRQSAANYKPTVEYPQTGLGNNLRSVAAMVVGGLSTRIYFTFHGGGFDTHGGQRPHHNNLMKELNDAVTTFYKDLAQQKQAHRVLLLTTSEFGRTVKENGTEGTDHGAASAQFLVGPSVKPGVHGAHPSLKDVVGGGGDWLKMTTDFRSLYATLLEKWMGIPSDPVLGEKFPQVDCIA